MHRLVADLDAALMQQVLQFPERLREAKEADIDHHRRTDDLRGGANLAKRAALGHAGEDSGAHAMLKLIPLTPLGEVLCHRSASLWTTRILGLASHPIHRMIVCHGGSV